MKRLLVISTTLGSLPRNLATVIEASTESSQIQQQYQNRVGTIRQEIKTIRQQMGNANKDQKTAMRTRILDLQNQIAQLMTEKNNRLANLLRSKQTQ